MPNEARLKIKKRGEKVMAFIEVNELNITTVLQEEFAKKQTVILKFGSEWCESCHALEGELEDVDDDNENISVLMIDTNEAQELAGQYSIHQLPTMLIYADNETLIYRGEGVMLAQDIEALIN